MKSGSSVALTRNKFFIRISHVDFIAAAMFVCITVLVHWLFQGGWIAPIGIAFMAWLAYENGGNDISKSISTLISGGVASYRIAIVSGTIATLLGSLASAWLGQKMVKLFSSGILDGAMVSSAALATIAGSILWVAIATRFSMPVSTTHAITGAIVGAGLISLGTNHIMWGALNSKILLPMLVSPIISIILALLLWKMVSILPNGKYLRIIHFFSGMLTAFARAMNDTPKIVALGFFVVSITGLNASILTLLFTIVASAMGLGSFFKGLPVSRTLAENITKMDDREALGANLTTALLVNTATRLGLPVSTTHVISSAIIGFGLMKGSSGVQWNKVRDMVLSWVVTLPVAGVFGLVIYLIFEYIL